MRYQDQQLREILDAVHYPVNPTHEAAFKTILLDDKRRSRRNLLWLCICGLGILAGGYGLVTATRVFQRAEQAIEKFTNPEQSTFRSATSASDAGTTLQGQAESSQNAAQNAQPLTEPVETSSTSSTTTGAPGAAGTSSSRKNNSSTSTHSNNTVAGKQSGQTAVTTVSGKSKSSLNQNKSQNPSAIGGTDKSATSDATATAMKANHNTAASPRQPQNSSNIDSDQTPDQINRQSHGTDLLNNNSTLLDADHEIADANEIIPSVHRVHKHRIHYGLSLAMYPAGSLFKKSAINTGFGYQVGGFATYRLNSRTQVRAEAGFAKLDGGFSYVKQSSSQQFGFSVLNQNHTLEAEKLYSGYASAEIGLINGKQIFSLGVISQYLYGARGDIETREHGQVETPIITRTENVWLSTRDIPKLSLHGTLGVRSKLSRRLELGALIRIPIMHTLREPSNLEEYQYTVKSHGVSPQFSLSYQLNQQ